MDGHAPTVSDWKEKAADCPSSTPLIPDHLSRTPCTRGVGLLGSSCSLGGHGALLMRHLSLGEAGARRCCWGWGRAAAGAVMLRWGQMRAVWASMKGGRLPRLNLELSCPSPWNKHWGSSVFSMAVNDGKLPQATTYSSHWAGHSLSKLTRSPALTSLQS